MNKGIEAVAENRMTPYWVVHSANVEGRTVKPTSVTDLATDAPLRSVSAVSSDQVNRSPKLGEIDFQV